MKSLVNKILIISVIMLLFVPIVPTVTSDGIFSHSENQKEYKVTLTGHDIGGTYGPGNGNHFGPLYWYYWPNYVFYQIENKTDPVFIVNGTHYENLLLNAPKTVYLCGFKGFGPTLLTYIILFQFEFTRIRVNGYCNEIRIEQRS